MPIAGWRISFRSCSTDRCCKAVCARDAGKRDAFAAAWGYEAVETDWRRLVERTDIDAVDICVPNNLHKEIALAAAAAGKMILCEKPLAMNVAEGEAMVAAVEAAGLPNMVWYNYRRIPSVSLARQLSTRAASAGPTTTGRSSCRTGPSPRTCRRAAPRSGGSMSTRPARASPAICWRTISTPRCG